jgi:transcriptional regulator with XRE-family HTH domain
VARERDPDKDLAAVLRELRTDQQRTQREVAHAVGITETALARIERGETNPTWLTVRAVVAALGVSLKEVGSALDERKQ